MPQFLLLKHYRGGPDLPEPLPPDGRVGARGRGSPPALPRLHRDAPGVRRVRRRVGLHPDRVWVQYGGTPARRR